MGGRQRKEGKMAKWIKHYSNAHKGKSNQDLAEEFGKAEGYGIYFLIVAYLNDKWDGISEPTFQIRTKELSNFLEISPKKFQKVGEILSKSQENSFIFEGSFCHIKFPKLLEIRHRDAISSGQRPATVQPNSSPNKIRIEEIREDKNINTISTARKPSVTETGAIDELKGNSLVETFLGEISQNSQKIWTQLYDVSFITRELLNMVEWYSRNPVKNRRSPTGKTKAASSWLKKNWDDHVNRAPTQRHGPKTFQEQRTDNNANVYQLGLQKAGGELEEGF